MEVVICSDEQQVGQIAANRVLQWVEGLVAPVLGLATGSSPLSLYNELARRVAAGEADFSCGIGFALDEYVGIDPQNHRKQRSHRLQRAHVFIRFPHPRQDLDRTDPRRQRPVLR